ncbi:MAG: hypothetical protein KF804_11475 [Burkholderiales bacterium]|nr:hypothetical protein [Burkholderiales bacterium]
MPPLQIISYQVRRSYHSVRNLTQREKEFLVGELQQARGLMPILMKQRNGQRWTPEERAELRHHFGRLSRLSPYLLLVVMPGGFLMLPLFAWWLDRRRLRQRGLPPA